MNYRVRMLGLTTLITLTLPALIGTSSVAASAKACSTSGAGAACAGSHGFEYTTQHYHGESQPGGVPAITSGFAKVECPSTVTGDVDHSGFFTIEALSFSVASCKSTLGPCTVAKMTGLPWSATAVTSTTPNGTLQMKNTIGAEFTCGGINCQYSAASAGTKGEITIIGGEPAKIAASKVPMSKIGGSGFCSATAEWDGVYTLTQPTSLFLT
jgi:hypothetical protein